MQLQLKTADFISRFCIYNLQKKGLLSLCQPLQNILIN
ncbi:hypothetical protein PISS_a1788 [Pseudoalteromonas issachenkonii]|uniref:Uncharacterized protein n=1 Tax=Pseudoalteromonas issachenkonii TaxID=152297 RepID=A0ABM6N2Y9_9GAMM|nr:hypothetical protein PISS_a1788 [Pseudoalteromonas issachenkonii]